MKSSASEPGLSYWSFVIASDLHLFILRESGKPTKTNP